MTPREEKVMLRDIHRIELALESISKSMQCIVGIKTPNDVIIGDSESKNTEETRE